MELTKFIGQVVISSATNRRFLIKRITAPEICVVTEVPGTSGYPEHYVYPTINGDPISSGALVFEDQTLTEPFKLAYHAHCRSEAGRCEEIGYWMRRG